MTVRRGFLSWGIFFICLGAVPLAVQLGLLDPSVASQLLRLWPLILIGIGLGILLRVTRYQMLGGAIVAGTFGIMFGSLLAGGFSSPAVACGSQAATSPTTTRTGVVDGASVELSMDLTCAQVDVSRASGQQWTVDVAGAEQPAINSTGGYLELASDRSGPTPLFFVGTRESWNVEVPTDSDLAASLTFTAASTRMNLGSGAISSLSATYTAADGQLDLSGAGPGSRSLGATLNASSVTVNLSGSSFDGSMTVNAGSLHLCAAPNDELHITYNETLSSDNFASAGLVGNGDIWQTPATTQANATIDLRLTANVSSITLDRSGGCQ